MREPDLFRDELRTRAYLYLLQHPNGLPQGSVARALHTKTSDMSRILDRRLCSRSGPQRRPIWSARPGFFIESVIGHYRTCGIARSDTEAEECRRWLRDHYVNWLPFTSGADAQSLRFADHLDAIAWFAVCSELITESVGFVKGAKPVPADEDRQRVEDQCAQQISERVPGLLKSLGESVPPEFRERAVLASQRDAGRIARLLMSASRDLPEFLRARLAQSTTRGRDAAAAVWFLTKGLDVAMKSISSE